MTARMSANPDHHSTGFTSAIACTYETQDQRPPDPCGWRRGKEVDGRHS
jgi:hypothetical protein